MSIVKIEDVSHVRFAAPDLTTMRAFLEDFRLVAVPSDDGVLYAKGAGSAPFVHATCQGDAGFAALGLRAASLSDLAILAAAEGVPVEDFAAPGGGKVVRLRDPDGRRVEVVAGQAGVDPIATEYEFPRNTAVARTRLRAPVRLRSGPATVVRLGHCVLNVADFRACEA